MFGLWVELHKKMDLVQEAREEVRLDYLLFFLRFSYYTRLGTKLRLETKIALITSNSAFPIELRTFPWFY